MVDIKLLEEVIQDIDDWSYGDLKEIRVLTECEIKAIVDEDVEMACNNDIYSLCVTALHYMRNKTIIKTEDIWQLPDMGTKRPTTVKYETHGVDKCPNVTCEK